MDSVVLRTLKLMDRNGESRSQHVIAMTQVSLAHSLNNLEAAARKVLAAVAEGDTLRMQLVILRRLFKYEPFNTIALNQQIANRMIDAGKYVIA
jgi:butyryl-CoA dehydrogenase